MNIIRQTFRAVITLAALSGPFSVSSAQDLVTPPLAVSLIEDGIPYSTFDSVAKIYHYSNGKVTSTGSGSCVGITSKYYVFLTNQHVAEGKGQDVRVEMYIDGRKSPRFKGQCIYAKNFDYHDAAVVIIPRDDVWVPKPVKLALDYVPTVDDLICDYGCSTGRAPRMRLGRIISVGNKTFTYTPPAWPGGSGSPVLDPTGEWQIGITTWNNGRSNPTWGKAQVISRVVQIISDNWSHSDPEVAKIFDAEAAKDGLFKRPPTQQEEWRGFFRRLLDNQTLHEARLMQVWSDVIDQLQQNKEDRGRLRDELVQSQEEIVGLLDRLRANRLRHEQQLLELERQRYEMERELEEKYGKQFQKQEEELRGIRGLFQRVMTTLEWVFYIACVVGFFWLMSTLFGPGWLGASIGALIKTIRATVLGISKGFTSKVD